MGENLKTERVMKSCVFISVLLGAALFLGGAVQAQAADTYENPAGHTPPGLEKQHKVPPGQAKKMDNDYKGRKHQDGKRYDGDRRHDGNGRYDRDKRHDRDARDKRYDGDRRNEKRDGNGVRQRERRTEREG